METVQVEKKTKITGSKKPSYGDPSCSSRDQTPDRDPSLRDSTGKTWAARSARKTIWPCLEPVTPKHLERSKNLAHER